MDAVNLLPYLALAAPVLLALAAAVGWVLNGRRPRAKPPATPSVIEAAHVEHARRVEVAELDHTATVEEIEGREGLPVEQRRAKAVQSWKGRVR